MIIPILLAAAALAGEAAPRDWKLPDACRDDAAALCPGKTGEELRRCLEPLEPKAAAACRKALEKAEDKARTVKTAPAKGVAACHDDVERLCKDVVPGEGRLGDCLFANLDKLSKKCRRYARHGGKGHEREALRELDKVSRAGPEK